MSLRLRSNQHLKLAGLLSAGLYVIVVSFVILSDEIFTQLDYQTLDWFHRLAVEHGRGPQDSPHIVYLTITDSTYKAFNSNTLDRARLVPVNMALAALDVEAVAYDLGGAREKIASDARNGCAEVLTMSTLLLISVVKK